MNIFTIRLELLYIYIKSLAFCDDLERPDGERKGGSTERWHMCNYGWFVGEGNGLILNACVQHHLSVYDIYLCPSVVWHWKSSMRSRYYISKPVLYPQLLQNSEIDRNTDCAKLGLVFIWIFSDCMPFGVCVCLCVCVCSVMSNSLCPISCNPLGYSAHGIQ